MIWVLELKIKSDDLSAECYGIYDSNEHVHLRCYSTFRKPLHIPSSISPLELPQTLDAISRNPSSHHQHPNLAHHQHLILLLSHPTPQKTPLDRKKNGTRNHVLNHRPDTSAAKKILPTSLNNNPPPFLDMYYIYTVRNPIQLESYVYKRILD